MAFTKSLSQLSFRSPYFIFLLFYTVYNLVGLVNTGMYYFNDFDTQGPWKLFLTGLVGYLLGYLFSIFVKRCSRNLLLRKEAYVVVLKPFFPKVILPLSLVISLIILTILFIKSKGIPLFLGEKRFSLPPFFFNFYRMFEYLFLFYYVHTRLYKKNFKKIWLVIFLLFLLLSLGTGYRTQVIEALLFLSLFEFFSYNLPFFKLLKYSIALITISSLIALYRVEIDYDALNFFRNINVSFFKEHPYLFPLLPFFSLMRYSQYTVYQIYHNLGNNYFLGYLAISNFLTLLPGEQPGMRNIVGEIIGARIVNGKYMSHTPTLQGAFYIDFGLLGVFFLFFLVGTFISLFDIRKYIQRKDSFHVYVLMYIYTYTCLSIHVGYWDIIVLVFLLSCFIILCSVQKRKFIIGVH